MNFASFLLNDPDANMEILDQPRYEGAISSISNVTNVVDAGFIMFITFIAFFIISVAMLRNVLAGAYVAYPKFWDKVAEAHDEKREVAYYERVTGFFKEGWKSASGGSLEKFILRFVPNVKLWTDFAEAGDNEIAPKDYFIKAIPQMILVIIIGVFIYNGYYRDTANKITGVGAELFHRFITEVDPTEVIYRITESSGTPEFASDDSEDRKMQLINKISHDAYAAILSKYNDIVSTAAKTQLAAAVENWVTNCVEENVSEYASSPKWDPKYKLTLTTAPSRQQDSKSNDGNTRIFVLGSVNVKDFGFESTVAADEHWFLNAVVTFNKQTVRKNIINLNDIELTCEFRINDETVSVSDNVLSRLNVSASAKLHKVKDGKKVCTVRLVAEKKSSGTQLKISKSGNSGVTTTQFGNEAFDYYKVEGVTINMANYNHEITAIHKLPNDDKSEKFTSKTARAFSKGHPIDDDWPDDIYAEPEKPDKSDKSDK